MPTATRVSGLLLAARSRIRLLAVLLFIFAGVLHGPALFAQANSEEFILVKSYKLPESAVPFSYLKEVNNAADLAVKPMQYQGELFSGLSYELYKNKALSRVQTYKAGILDGPSYVWYPDGNPQMYVNYRHGALSGRFMGWYMHGGILYDMVINSGGYAGDYIEDERSADSGTEDEADGDAVTSDKE